MAITRTAMIDDDGSGTTGTILNNAWKQELYGQIDALAGSAGVWTNVPYSAANFAGSAGAVWTVESADQATFAYAVVGRTVFLTVSLNATSISGSPGSPLLVTLPGGITPAKAFDAVCFAVDATGPTTGRVRMLAGDPHVYLYRLDGANWSVSANNMNISVQVVYAF